MDATQPLRNLRHEKVCQLAATGVTLIAAYIATYGCSKTSARGSVGNLRALPMIQARITAIQKDSLTQYDARMTRDALHDWLTIVVDKGLMGKTVVPPRDRLKAASLLASIGGYHAPARSEKLSLHASLDVTKSHTDFSKRLAAAKQIKGEGGTEERGVVVTPLAHTGDSEVSGTDSIESSPPTHTGDQELSGESEEVLNQSMDSAASSGPDKVEPSLESASDSQAVDKVDSSKESPLDPKMGHGP